LLVGIPAGPSTFVLPPPSSTVSRYLDNQ